MQQKIKVLVTDDSFFMRKLISDMLNDHPLIEVITTANNGMDLLEKLTQYSPDVITLDIEMPVMDGLTALEKMISNYPIPTIMLSSTTKEGAHNTIKAMELGAIDFVPKPSGAISLDLYKVKEELISKIIHASKVSMKNRKLLTLKTKAFDSIEKQNLEKKQEIQQPLKQKHENHEKTIIAIGTSTGGPRALQQVLTSLPGNINAPIFIVQHMPPGFTKSLSDRLNTLSKLTVVEAEHNMYVLQNTAYIAPGGYHMEVVKDNVDKLIIQLNQSPPIRGHRPAVDVLFQSISLLDEWRKVVTVLTGMGNDGTLGIQAIKQKDNAYIIAESEVSSIVYGMPKSAKETGLVDEVAELNDIANVILNNI
ncbi:protein-glutamate methylesterase/protein-glutamine glutaminase [Bacillus alkalisoli]|uniref:protein-glutamate methylesterase/protein-glutamine glutaminase n=1 Tax=Bacillus alkalisoli TaxID=2011008 RepID=UPI000C233652|nr:chemotaxis response regulator protein-glutamate methylesterase [Bacillus alkalisoli]